MTCPHPPLEFAKMPLALIQNLYERYSIVRFLLWGGINTLFGYSVYAAMIYTGLAYPIAGLISTIAGILFNFQTSGRFVFNNKDSRHIIRFAGVYGVTYLIGMGSIALISQFGANLYWAGALSLIPTTAVSFLLNRHVVFKK